ncbi:MAG: hypothetical protein UT41_C0001G0269 [Candidatus Wolfebacteria bacterium GW2011_GWC2_39_22]|uniref:Type 4 fimbrial biogenesis protein PilX N-terminal domain-containing protein n=1 Tax=Candidatus Wolfebacteria bacterium GW2011_GWC2_39_22 TaxID=1619013 RepID=A0A0G0QQS6_9BACT|nr:MAG: hypothetical protein UT41_C0001G0269 [Candidatus Wolfebacteria bacterium GW2011_GWC2_39_22]HBI25613.1 hypothetical protein [Candidatus Wolfebacteria bacterium]
MKQQHIKKTSGFLLIEAMVAMSVLLTSVMGVFILMSQSIKLTRTLNDQYVATYLAGEGIEIAKNILDASVVADPAAWNVDNNFHQNGCYALDYASNVLADSCSDMPLSFNGTNYGYSVGGDTSSFVRKVNLALVMDGSTQIGVRVTSTVTWAGGTRTFALEDVFYAWL